MTMRFLKASRERSNFQDVLFFERTFSQAPHMVDQPANPISQASYMMEEAGILDALDSSPS